MDDAHDDSGIRRRGTETRSGGLRHRVALPARIEWGGGGVIDAEIRDVSSMGMYLRHRLLVGEGGEELLSLGTTVRVLCPVRHPDSPRKVLSLAAEVVRCHPHGVGVRFADTSKEERLALRYLALHAVESRAASEAPEAASNESVASNVDARALMSACRKIIERRMPNVVWTLRTEIVKQLRLMPGGSTAMDAGADAQALEDKGTGIGLTIERRVLQAFAEMGGLDDTQELVLSQVQRAKIKAAAAGENLDLVENAAIAGDVARDAAARRMESALISRSFDINLRLANVLRRRIDNIENPLVPAVMCRILWSGFTQYCDTTRVHECLHDSLVKLVIPLLAEIYDELDKTLNQFEVPKAFGGDSARSAASPARR